MFYFLKQIQYNFFKDLNLKLQKHTNEEENILFVFNCKKKI